MFINDNDDDILLKLKDGKLYNWQNKIRRWNEDARKCHGKLENGIRLFLWSECYSVLRQDLQ